MSLLQREWLERSDAENVAVHVVWVPRLGAESRHVPGASRLLPDPRARHYWDPGQVLGRAYADDLVEGAVDPLWDVYFLYGPDATWDDTLPRPLEFWMQQLPEVGELAPRLDAETFARVAETLGAGSP